MKGKYRLAFGFFLMFMIVSLTGCGLSDKDIAATENTDIVKIAESLAEQGSFEAGDIYLDSILYGNYSQAEEPELLALCKFRNNVHAAGLDRTLAIVFRQDSMEVVAYKEFGHDEVVLRPLPTEAESRILFIGRTTYQDITTQYLSLYYIEEKEWIECPIEGVNLQEEDLCYITDDNKLLVVPQKNGEYPTEMIPLWEEQMVYEWDEHGKCFAFCSEEIVEETTDEAGEKIVWDDLDNDEEQDLDGMIAVRNVDWGAFETAMNADEYEALQTYMPILTGNENFIWQSEESANRDREVQTVTIDEFRYILNNECFDYEPDELLVHGVAVCDLDQDGNLELILELHNIGGRYLILRNESGIYYGMDRGIRSFLQLQTNGSFIASGGAAHNYYHQLQFKDGKFEDVLLGYMSLDEENEESVFYIGEEKVEFNTFSKWENNILSEDVVYYEVTELAEGEMAEPIEDTFYDKDEYQSE